MEKVELTEEELYKIELAFEVISKEIEEIRCRIRVQDCSNSLCLLAEFAELSREKTRRIREGQNVRN
jgi:hypothetical protein